MGVPLANEKLASCALTSPVLSPSTHLLMESSSLLSLSHKSGLALSMGQVYV